jgi:hypothetical protein
VVLGSAVSEQAGYTWVLARRVPFLGIAWLVGGQFFIATALAYLTYTFFDWFDRFEVGANKKLAIAAWIKRRPYKQLDIRSLIIDWFDRLYGYPLTSIKGFLRASLVTIVAWAGYLCFVAANTSPGPRVAFFTDQMFFITFPFVLGGWIVCDYISFILVRKYLAKAFDKLIPSLILAFLISIFVIYCSYVVIHWIAFIIVPATYFGVGGSVIYSTLFRVHTLFRVSWDVIRLFLAFPYAQFRMIEPALWVHIWLLLFALGAVGSRLVYWAFQAIEGTQWLIGDQHPVRAIGLVAAVLIFAVSLTWPHL